MMLNSEKYWVSDYQDVLHEREKELNEYLLSLKLENKDEPTITKYRRVLESFLTECSISLEELTSDDIRMWLNDLSLGKSEPTINLHLSVISSFVDFCVVEEDEYERVNVVSEQLGSIDRALVVFLLSTGCRVSEVSNLNIQDVNL